MCSTVSERLTFPTICSTACCLLTPKLTDINLIHTPCHSTRCKEWKTEDFLQVAKREDCHTHTPSYCTFSNYHKLTYLSLGIVLKEDLIVENIVTAL